MPTPTSKDKLEKRRAELTKRWHRHSVAMEQATARLAEAYLAIETIKTQIKAIDFDLDSMVDNKWQAVEEAHEEEEVIPHRHSRWPLRVREEELSDENSM